MGSGSSPDAGAWRERAEPGDRPGPGRCRRMRQRPRVTGYSPATAALTSSRPSSSVSTTGARPGACST